MGTVLISSALGDLVTSIAIGISDAVPCEQGPDVRRDDGGGAAAEIRLALARSIALGFRPLEKVGRLDLVTFQSPLDFHCPLVRWCGSPAGGQSRRALAPRLMRIGRTKL
jgi:hypothetical protein